jgi:[heparan sulfate]-glucosamine 3-sulfotransferase 5
MCVQAGKHTVCLPSFVIIGAMKSGTGELQSWLALHPNLLPYNLGGVLSEAHYFDKLDGLGSLPGTWLGKYMLSGFKFKGPNENRLGTVYTFEKTPKYLIMSRERIVALRTLMPSVRLLAILRNPMSRAYSHYQHSCRRGLVIQICGAKEVPEALRHKAMITPDGHLGKDGLSGIFAGKGVVLPEACFVRIKYPCPPALFDSMMYMLHPSFHHASRELDGVVDLQQRAAIIKKTMNISRADLENGKYGLLMRGHYADQFQAWLTVFPAEQMLAVVSEELFQDPVAGMDRVQAFLGLPRLDYKPLMEVVNNKTIIMRGAGKSKAVKRTYERPGSRIMDFLEMYYAPSLRLLDRYIDKARLVRFWNLNPYWMD